MTIYVPDSLAAEMKDKLGDVNISSVCQDAIRAEIARRDAMSGLNPEDFRRIEVYDERKDRDVAFHGLEIGGTRDQTAYLTAKQAIAVYDSEEQRLYVYGTYAEFAGHDQALELVEQVADALGERYVEELDI